MILLHRGFWFLGCGGDGGSGKVLWAVCAAVVEQVHGEVAVSARMEHIQTHLILEGPVLHRLAGDDGSGRCGGVGGRGVWLLGSVHLHLDGVVHI